MSQFNFQSSHIACKHNQVVDALSWRPKVNVVSIATYSDASYMIGKYVIDLELKDIILEIALGKKEKPFNVQDDFLLYGNRLCIIHSLHDKVMYKSHVPPYVGHRGIQATTQAIETYSYLLSMQKDIQEYDRGKGLGLLHLLPIPNDPWESI